MSRVESDYYRWMGYDPAHAKQGLAHYLPLFPTGPVLELASGRGEFLELLRDAGVAAEGIDSDEGMVEQSRSRGLTVQHADALTGLQSRTDDSVRGVFSAHFAEHLTPPDLLAVITESARVLAPGGVFVAATPNASAHSVIGHDFWVDPTHVRPYAPPLLAFLCAQAGLEVVETAGNPANHAGPPPETYAPVTTVDPELGATVSAMVQRATDPTGSGRSDPRSPWHTLGLLVGQLDERLRATQQQLAEVNRSYGHLLNRLYPSNEVYVVARAV